jgi:epsin
MTPSWTMILILCGYVDVPQQEQQQMMYAQQQQAAMQAQYQQQQAYEDYMRQQQMMYMQQQQQQPNQQPIQAQPTGFGANNPFAAFAAPPQASPSPAPPPPQQESASNGFESSYRPEPAPAPAPVQEQQPQRTGGGRYKTGGDERHSELARMLAGGREDGLDTFGNVGATRVPVWQQKTGQGQGPMMPQTTGLAKPLNPFGTGVTTYRPQQFNQPTGQQQQQQQNVRSDLSPALLLATLSLSRALTSHALYPAERTALLHDLSRI